jgi:hypothetical protein
VFPGNRHTVRCLRPAVRAAETALELAPKQRKRVVWRLDGGAGSDEQVRWLLERDYHIIAKGMSNRRAGALAKQVKRWDAYSEDAWLGSVACPVTFPRPVQMWVKRCLKDGKPRHTCYLTTLSLPSKGAMMSAYNNRGGAEVEQFRSDKSGLHLAARRKRSLAAQKGLVLFTDLAHNLLSDFHHQALTGSCFEGFGPKRIVRDLLAIPGMVTFNEASQVKSIDLLKSHPYAEKLLICLERYGSGD